MNEGITSSTVNYGLSTPFTNRNWDNELLGDWRFSQVGHMKLDKVTHLMQFSLVETEMMV